MTDGRTAILHLGTYKTGSSAIQNFLYANRALLAERGLLYPQTGLIKSDEIGYRHRRLVEAVLKGEAGSYVPRPLRDELQQSPQPQVLFSAEAWSNPRQIPILGGFATELGDIGIARVEGVVFLRRLIDYKISHYREFTTRHGNRKPFHDYVRQAPGMFDYLFLIRNFRAIFGARLRVLDYARTDNSITALFDGLGWSGLLAGLETDTRANLRPLGALEVEIIRQASLAGLPPARAPQLVAHVRQTHPDLFAQAWTEREAPESFVYGPGYRRELAGLLGWPADDVDRLLEDRPPEGQPVATALAHLAPTITDWLAHHPR